MIIKKIKAFEAMKLTGLSVANSRNRLTSSRSSAVVSRRQRIELFDNYNYRLFNETSSEIFTISTQTYSRYIVWTQIYNQSYPVSSDN